MKTAIYPGSFDPVTLGHINIIKRAAVAFDKVIVCVMVNSEKNGGLFTPEERIDLMRKSIQVSNVEFDVNYGLVAEYAKSKGARVLVKGLRAVSDFEQEVQMAMINSKINPRSGHGLLSLQRKVHVSQFLSGQGTGPVPCQPGRVFAPGNH